MSVTDPHHQRRSNAHSPLESLYRGHYRRVRWVLRARRIDDDELDDVVHDVFVALAQRLGSRDPHVPLACFVTAVARNVAFSHRRSRARRTRTLRALRPPPPSPRPDEHFGRREAWRQLASFLDDLHDAQREVFVLIELLGMRAQEVATTMSIPVNTVYSRLRLARRRFEAFLETIDDDPQAWLLAAGEGERPPAKTRRRTWALIWASVGRPLGPAAPPVIGWGGPLLAGAVTGAALGVMLWRPSAPAEAEPQPTAVVRHVESTSTPTPTLSPAIMPPPSPVARKPAPHAPPPPAVEPRASSNARATSTTHPPVHSRVPGVHAADLPPHDPLAEVVATLEGARRELAADRGLEALALLDEHRRQFPQSPMRRELLLLDLRAACTIGDTSRARATHHTLVERGFIDASRLPCASSPTEQRRTLRPRALDALPVGARRTPTARPTATGA